MQKTDIAIVGMSCVFPGAEDAETFWQNIINKVDSIQPVPAHRIDQVHFDQQTTGADRFYCNRGGFIPDIAFDAASFGILPVAVQGTEPDHLITLVLVKKALEDAGIPVSANQKALKDINTGITSNGLNNNALQEANSGSAEKNNPLEKAGIIIGKGNYAGPGATRAIEIIRTGEQIAQVLKELLPHLEEKEIEKVKKEYQLRKGRFEPDTAMGLIPNLVASLVANRFNLGGVAYTVDAACASSLIAIDQAVNELTSRRSNLMIAGGVHVGQNTAFWSIFNQLGALSKKGKITPFDTQADGLLIGEGCGFVVLKRLDDAVRDDDKIYAVLKGIGVSSDGSGTSVMSPAVKGQLKAIQQAWENAGLPAKDIGYIEAHGTGTPLGDQTELETLSQFFGNDQGMPRAGIGTVKSNIGHAMPASGIAGIIKTALALYHGIIPPTLHCDEPVSQLGESRFDAVKNPVNWAASGLPKIAGVNAFGFGGINAHVVLAGYSKADTVNNGVVNQGLDHEDPVQNNQRNQQIPPQQKDELFRQKDEVLLLARHTHEELLLALTAKDKEPGAGKYRIAVFNPTAERITKARKIAVKNLPWRNKQDIWYSNEPLLSGGGKIAFVFPGMDGLTGMPADDVAAYFNIVQKQHTQTAGLLNEAYKLLDKSSILDAALKELGIWPAMNAGHSLGEWLAAKSSALAEETSVAKLLQLLDPETFNLKDSRFIAVGCGITQINALIAGIKDLYLSNDNCPQQVILCGSHEAIEELIPVLKAKQIFHHVLPFQSGFHSPFIADKLELLLEGMREMEFRKTQIPLWSATTLDLYPEDFEQIRQLCADHLIKPVRFRELIEKLYQQEGASVFIQVGSGGLTGFIDDTLKRKNYSAVAANVPIRSAIAQLQRVLAALFVEGQENGMDFMGYSKKENAYQKGIKLELGSPLVSQLNSLKELAVQPEKKKQEVVFQDLENPLFKVFQQNVEEMISVQSAMFELFQQHTEQYQSLAAGQVSFDQSQAYSPQNEAYLAQHQNLAQFQNYLAQDLVTAAQNPPFTPQANSVKHTPERTPFSRRLDITLTNSPYLIDHSLLRQPANWSCVEDMDPVIPMTMIFELFAETAKQQSPAETVQKIMNIKVFQWMNVAQPFRELITGEWKNEQVASLSLERFATAEVMLGSTHPQPVIKTLEIGRPLKINRTPEQIYDEHMFHGPAYQGIRKILAVAENGITGLIEGSTGKGSLLDNAGQLFGLWLQLTLSKDRIAFPVKIQEIEFYAAMEDQQGLFECTCMLTELTEEFATADFIIQRNQQIWAKVSGWQNRRLEIDDALWSVSMSPLHNRLSTEIAPGVFMFHNAYSRVVSWDFILKRYFGQEEKKHYHTLMPNKKKEWMISRVAVKDAVRNLLQLQKQQACYPITFSVRSNEVHQPYLQGDLTAGIHISIAHKGTDAVGIAQYDRPVGIDLELIEERSEGFYELVFSAGEQALLADREKSEWATRFWVAKEAYGKYLGKGLQGNPKAYTIAEIKGETLRINDIFIQTIKYKNYIIGWTL